MSLTPMFSVKQQVQSVTQLEFLKFQLYEIKLVKMAEVRNLFSLKRKEVTLTSESS